MHLLILIENYEKKPTESVPDWMIGCFKRRSITFANGMIDTDTHVFWLQSRNITIDLRLPIEAEQVSPKPLQACSARELRQLANYEGWYADSLWQNGLLSWSGGTSFQIHNRWPEPAILSRVGDCMMEFSPNSTYVEDWRIKSRCAGPLLGLRLIQEVVLETGQVRHRDGALIINGDWAGLVLGRVTAITGHGSAGQDSTGQESTVKDTTGQIRAGQLRDRVEAEHDNQAFLQQVFNFETSVATGDLTSGFEVVHSTCPDRKGRPLLSLDGFEFDHASHEIVHTFDENGLAIERRYTIDALEPHFAYSGATKFTEEAASWFRFEQETLGRYLQVLEQD